MPEMTVWIAFVVTLLAVTVQCCGLLVNRKIALVSGRAGNWLARIQAFVKWQQRLVGGVLIGPGLRLAFDSTPQAAS